MGLLPLDSADFKLTIFQVVIPIAVEMRQANLDRQRFVHKIAGSYNAQSFVIKRARTEGKLT